jgi:hypothetical protein
MGQVRKAQMGRAKEGLKLGLALPFDDVGPSPRKGTLILEMHDARTGELLHREELHNIITKDAGIASAAHYTGDLVGGLVMLGIGTGATGNLLNPDAPQNTQRKLNNEIQRKPFASKQYRTAGGVAVSYYTNIVDFTTTFGESEAVGALNEMGLMVTASQNPATLNPINNGPNDYDPTIDVGDKDLLVNYITFAVVSKPATAVLSITWRLTF